MKKLMIAAAAAAMIGGLYADVGDTCAAYTLQINVKTTVGKAGKTTSTVQYDLGFVKGTTNFWYNDANVLALRKADTNKVYFTTKTMTGRKIPCLTSKAKKDTDWLLDTLKIEDLAKKYKAKSSKGFCESLKIKTTDEGCYRVSGSRKLKATVYGDICCEDLADEEETVDVTVDFAQFFGGLTYDKAKKAELLADVKVNDSESFPEADLTIAGQGSKGAMLYWFENDDSEWELADDKKDGITSISGNVVGELAAPECEYCCSANDPAVAFTCGDAAEDPTLTTAAYGSFSIKYNASETKKMLNP